MKLIYAHNRAQPHPQSTASTEAVRCVRVRPLGWMVNGWDSYEVRRANFCCTGTSRHLMIRNVIMGLLRYRGICTFILPRCGGLAVNENRRPGKMKATHEMDGHLGPSWWLRARATCSP